MKSRETQIQTMADKRNSVLSMLHDVSIACLCLECISHRVYA